MNLLKNIGGFIFAYILISLLAAAVRFGWIDRPTDEEQPEDDYWRGGRE